MMLKRILLVVLLLAAAFAAAAREVPIRDFFKDPEFTSIALSPDGRHMAVTVPQADRTVLAVLRVADKGLVGKWDYGPDRHFREVVWANNERLLFYVTFKTGRFDFETSKGDLYASNIDGTQRIDIPNGAYYSIVDMTPEDPQTILVERSIESAFLFKLNVYNGRITTVATAPVERGRFLVDHARNPRFVYGQMDDGRNVAYRRDGDKWTLVHESERNGATYYPLGFAGDDRHAYVAKGVDGKPESIVRVDTRTWEETQLSSNGTVSPSGLVWSSDRKTLLGVRYDDGIPYWDWIAPEHPETLAYAGQARTANGIVQTAAVLLDSVAIGEIHDSRVPAVVLRAELEQSLMGMSYLSRFARVSIEGNRLILER